MTPSLTCEVLAHWNAIAVARRQAEEAIARYIG